MMSRAKKMVLVVVAKETDKNDFASSSHQNNDDKGNISIASMQKGEYILTSENNDDSQVLIYYQSDNENNCMPSLELTLDPQSLVPVTRDSVNGNIYRDNEVIMPLDKENIIITIQDTSHEPDELANTLSNEESENGLRKETDELHVQLEDNVCNKRKRKADPDPWQRNVRKRQRMSGKACKTTTGKIIGDNIFKPVDSCSCRFQCTKKIPPEHQKAHLKNIGVLMIRYGKTISFQIIDLALKHRSTIGSDCVGRDGRTRRPAPNATSEDRIGHCKRYYEATDKTELEEEFQTHFRRKSEAMKMKEEDMKKGALDKTQITITFDLLVVLCVPFAGDSQIYYRPIPDTVDHIVKYSDTAGCQNRNQYITSVMLYATNKLQNLETIDLKFMEPGHSYLEADSMHATID
ncbi:hypothetical protein PR048_027599 [Dryococelus australis]|uniref:Uncharacterized protein n=1 Tax=Dryococelus australis TaxID=614101 RepID=A0ABQ9GGY4_9NEOP|nr:hypothetical protein PR048_027599 [Dryococelus australis]